jgi:signal transduction histidine kinase
MGNGLKFHREGVPPVVRVSVEAGTGAASGETMQLTVADNGIGFEPRHADRIFVPFERLHGRAAYEGTGIGLAICHKIVERHGGSITASGRPGEGATFSIVLPLTQGAPTGQEPAA